MFGPGDGGTGSGGPSGPVPEPEIAPALPNAAPSNTPEVVLPPVNAPASPPDVAGETQMTLMAPSGSERSNMMDWAIVVAVALMAEVGLLWGASCFGLWRRRIALERAEAEAVQGAG